MAKNSSSLSCVLVVVLGLVVVTSIEARDHRKAPSPAMSPSAEVGPPAKPPKAAPKGKPRAFFVFGDSLVDNGNNNYLMTTARADMPPYGIDSTTHLPTGRFSNGHNIPDLISQAMGKSLLLPYLSPDLTGEKLLEGANFASAGIGILNDTGLQFANIVKIVDQLKNFEEYQKKVSKMIGEKKKTELIRKSLVLSTLGGNDFVNNYFLLPYSPRSFEYSIPEYVKLLMTEYRVILMKLYEMGARRVLVTGTGQLGCVPAEMALRSRDGQCVPALQKASALFNPALAQLLKSLNQFLGADVFIGANTHQMHLDFISKPKDFGFVSSNVACCGQGPYNGIGLCSMVSNLCTNRDEYAFWDAFHPSERANKVIVEQIFRGTEEYMHPMNLSTMMHLDFIAG